MIQLRARTGSLPNRLTLQQDKDQYLTAQDLPGGSCAAGRRSVRIPRIPHRSPYIARCYPRISP